MMKCLLNQKVVQPEIHELAESHKAHKKIVWEYQMGELMKTERVLEGIVCYLFAELISLCDSDT